MEEVALAARASPALHAHRASLSVRAQESKEVHGHITSLAVLRSHRKLALATKLMNAAQKV
jgi:ribosomal protein S18 acetylase RimI-like enzyme